MTHTRMLLFLVTSCLLWKIAPELQSLWRSRELLRTGWTDETRMLEPNVVSASWNGTPADKGGFATANVVSGDGGQSSARQPSEGEAFKTTGQVDLSSGLYSGGHPTVSIGDHQYGLSANGGTLYLFSTSGISFVRTGTGEFAKVDSKGAASFGGLRTSVRAVSGNDTATVNDHTLIANTTTSFVQVLPSSPAPGQELDIVNVGPKPLIVVSRQYGIGNVSTDIPKSLTIQPGQGVQLQFDHVSATKAWRLLHGKS